VVRAENQPTIEYNPPGRRMIFVPLGYLMTLEKNLKILDLLNLFDII
jgi:hypothetical protein